ncbi:hypothetical protein CALVIDRAFT_279108 [Calocera viscosa TUFC12733]|uniref:Uncharacterized protein n=1 Tax=Calocera viscosa (strain TUFC12733) TaxID=1330018 RepID=A0A167R3Y9_CALVF|nr:hypothetical protein CALVIDRAFT_279108 [Calocera viscosa TUFC12733]
MGIGSRRNCVRAPSIDCGGSFLRGRVGITPDRMMWGVGHCRISNVRCWMSVIVHVVIHWLTAQGSTASSGNNHYPRGRPTPAQPGRTALRGRLEAGPQGTADPLRAHGPQFFRPLPRSNSGPFGPGSRPATRNPRRVVRNKDDGRAGRRSTLVVSQVTYRALCPANARLKSAWSVMGFMAGRLGLGGEARSFWVGERDCARHVPAGQAGS